MPNFYAHLTFGRAVLEQLPDELHRELEEPKYTEAYTLGQFGPDPLFFYKPYRVTHARIQAVVLHRNPMYEMLPRMRRAMESEDPWARGYAAGLLCHYALDSRCHAYVVKNSGVSGMGHTTMEVEFDRFLAERDGLNACGSPPRMAAVLPAEFYDMVQGIFYPGIEKDGYPRGLSFFERTSQWHGQAAERGTVPLALGLAAKRFPRARTLQNLAIVRPQGGVYDEHDRNLLALMENEVQPAAEHLAAFFDGTIDLPWFCRSMHGEEFKVPAETDGSDGETVCGEQPPTAVDDEEATGVKRAFLRAERSVLERAISRDDMRQQQGETPIREM